MGARVSVIYDDFSFELNGDTYALSPDKRFGRLEDGIRRMIDAIGRLVTQNSKNKTPVIGSFGPTGHGKSSTINLVQSVIKDEMCRAAMAGATGATVTSGWDSHTMEGTNGCIWWDTPGDIIQKMLCDVTNLRALRAQVDDMLEQCKRHSISCIMLHMDGTRIMENGTHLLRVFREIHEKALAARIGVTCVITKVDKLDPAIRNRTKHVSASEKVSDLRKRVEREVGVCANQINVVVNFLEERQPQADRAKCWLGLLAFHCAIQYASTVETNAPRARDNAAALLN